MFRNNSFYFVSIAGFFGPSYLAIFFHSIFMLSLMQYSCLTEEAMTEESCHSRLIASLNEKQKEWDEYGIDVIHRFYASVDDERLYPIKSFPKLNGVAPENYIIVKGWDHNGLTEGLADEYLLWCLTEATNKKKQLFMMDDSNTNYNFLAECYMALDKLSVTLTREVSREPSAIRDSEATEKLACDDYKKYIVANEEAQNLKWSKDFVRLNFSNGIILGALVKKGFEIFPITNRCHEECRQKTKQDIDKWIKKH